MAPEDPLKVLASRLNSLPIQVHDRRPIALGTYRGLEFGIILQPHFGPDVYLAGAGKRLESLAKDHHGPAAILNALERLAGSYTSQSESVRQELALAQSQLRDYQARYGQAFRHESYMTELAGLRDQLRISLSGTATEGGLETSELASRIKALKARKPLRPHLSGSASAVTRPRNQ